MLVICSSEGCDREAYRPRSKMCREHYNASRRVPGANLTSRKNPDGTPATCGWETGCERFVRAAGLCSAHYQAHRNGGYAARKPCPIPGCARTDLYQTTPGCKKHYQMSQRYSLSMGELSRLHANLKCQNPSCDEAINLHLDHDHACCPKGKFGTRRIVSCGDCVRGWLCRGCNWALGNTRESPKRLRGLAEYIERAPRVRR